MPKDLEIRVGLEEPEFHKSPMENMSLDQPGKQMSQLQKKRRKGLHYLKNTKENLLREREMQRTCLYQRFQLKEQEWVLVDAQEKSFNFTCSFDKKIVFYLKL